MLGGRYTWQQCSCTLHQITWCQPDVFPHCSLCLQEPDAQPQAPVPNGMPMTDLERQFFANSQSPSSESSDSSSDSDQESLNAASEDDDDDGLDHF